MYRAQGWQDIGLAFYRMSTGTVMPVHRDLYKRYIELFNLQGRENSIRRALVMLEDWKPGHIVQLDDWALTEWKAGDTWYFDTEVVHYAANCGTENFYTCQVSTVK
jgi:hypothetical protein